MTGTEEVHEMTRGRRDALNGVPASDYASEPYLLAHDMTRAMLDVLAGEREPAPGESKAYCDAFAHWIANRRRRATRVSAPVGLLRR